MRIIRLRELYYACSTIFFREVRCKTGRVVGDAAPYGGVIDGAVGRGDVGIAPYGRIIDGAVGRGDVGIAPYGSVTRNAPQVLADGVEPRPYGDYLKFLDGRCGCCDFL